MGVRGQRHAPAALYPRGKDPRYPLAGWAPEPVWTQDRRKIPCPCRRSNPDRPVVQPVVRHYTAWATRLLGRKVANKSSVVIVTLSFCVSYSFILLLTRLYVSSLPFLAHVRLRGIDLGSPFPGWLEQGRRGAPYSLQLVGCSASQHIASRTSFMEPIGSLPCSQELTTGSYPELVESNPHPAIFLWDSF
jgi:hypothetical protein